MKSNIDISIVNVNRHLYLTTDKRAYIVLNMKYGERLRLAREQAQMTQAALADLAQIKQPSVAYLENPNNNCQGSEFTARFARILKVSVDWLSDEIGEMNPIVYTTADPKIIAAARVMEAMPEYGKDAAVKEIASTAELIAAAQHPDNGTDG